MEVEYYPELLYLKLKNQGGVNNFEFYYETFEIEYWNK